MKVWWWWVVNVFLSVDSKHGVSRSVSFNSYLLLNVDFGYWMVSCFCNDCESFGCLCLLFSTFVLKLFELLELFIFLFVLLLLSLISTELNSYYEFFLLIWLDEKLILRYVIFSTSSIYYGLLLLLYISDVFSDDDVIHLLLLLLFCFCYDYYVFSNLLIRSC